MIEANTDYPLYMNMFEMEKKDIHITIQNSTMVIE